MKPRPIILSIVTAVLLAGVPSLASAAAPPPLGLSTQAVVVSIIDGDTVDLEVTTRVRVRLLDVWCPELNTQEGKSAKRYMESLALGKRGVLFIPEGRRQVGDSTTLGRVLGHVWIDGYEQSLSELMVEAKYATKEKPKAKPK